MNTVNSNIKNAPITDSYSLHGSSSALDCVDFVDRKRKQQRALLASIGYGGIDNFLQQSEEDQACLLWLADDLAHEIGVGVALLWDKYRKDHESK